MNYLHCYDYNQCQIEHLHFHQNIFFVLFLHFAPNLVMNMVLIYPKVFSHFSLNVSLLVLLIFSLFHIFLPLKQTFRSVHSLQNHMPKSPPEPPLILRLQSFPFHIALQQCPHPPRHNIMTV